MHASSGFTWSDAWLLLSVALAATRGHGTLEEVISWGDAINHAIFTGPELRRGFAKLIAAGHVTRTEGFDVSDQVRRIVLESAKRGAGRNVQAQLERFLHAAPYPEGDPRFEDPAWPFPDLTDAIIAHAVEAYHNRMRSRRMDPKLLVARSYDTIAERHAEWAAGVRQPERARFARLLIEAFPAGSMLLELGCGAGGATTRLLAQHFRLTGIDISARTIELARRAVPDADFIVSDLTTTEFPDGTFDCVAAFYSLIHVPRLELAALFKRIASWLRPGGLLVATLNGTDTPGTYEDDWLGVPMFWSGYGPEKTRTLAESAGFAVDSLTLETADEFGQPASFWWLSARRSVVPGQRLV